jgi:cation:H+ antiporter
VILDAIYIIGGLCLLVLGGELLVYGASKIAIIFGVKPIVIGLTVVAFGTSMPEAFVSALSTMSGKNDIAIANVVGSNIFNFLFILGLAAVVKPLKVERQSVRREVPFIIATSVLAWFLCVDGEMGRLDGMILLILFAVFLFVCVKSAISEDSDDNPSKVRGNRFKQIALVLSSLVILVVGAKLLLSGSVSIARHLGVSELLIGLTIIAAGTSLPELATSVMASIRGKDDIAVGNVTGSNIFNIGFILGISAIIHPLSVSNLMLKRDIVVMIVVSLLALPILKSGFKVSRMEGCFLVIAYVAYTAYLIGISSQ